ncbi:MAG: hypothetical protein HeimC3_53630 [Candidatus Heimdallarchaeota archaeon LC_3]|nr:MAG: hypothetical protein HeimC3_53630 [Candidatus Heimdallarchaeota archaeon LC_3]
MFSWIFSKKNVNLRVLRFLLGIPFFGGILISFKLFLSRDIPIESFQGLSNLIITVIFSLNLVGFSFLGLLVIYLFQRFHEK